MHLLTQITFVCQFQHDFLGPNSGDTQDFDGELHVFQKNIQGQSWCAPKFLVWPKEGPKSWIYEIG
jgi:hypothetical protein